MKTNILMKWTGKKWEYYILNKPLIPDTKENSYFLISQRLTKADVERMGIPDSRYRYTRE